MKVHLVFGLLISLVLSTSCSDSSGGSAQFQDAPPPPAPAPPPILTILVTNDDGIGAEGIDVMVNALAAMENVDVQLVAPATNQSGVADRVTDGEVTWEDSATTSGYMGVGVDGTPGDSVIVATQELGITPDVVVSGINLGLNVGPLVRFSGTVGGARIAARAGFPGVAASTGGSEEFAGFDETAALVVDWIEMNRSALLDGSASIDTVTSFNTPACSAGEIKELLEVPRGESVPAESGSRITSTDCTLEPATAPTNDVEAVVNGYAAVTLLPVDS